MQRILNQFNPIGRLRLRLKGDWFADFAAGTIAQLKECLRNALRDFMADPAKVASNTAFRVP